MISLNTYYTKTVSFKDRLYLNKYSILSFSLVMIFVFSCFFITNFYLFEVYFISIFDSKISTEHNLDTLNFRFLIIKAGFKFGNIPNQ